MDWAHAVIGTEEEEPDQHLKELKWHLQAQYDYALQLSYLATKPAMWRERLRSSVLLWEVEEDRGTEEATRGDVFDEGVFGCWITRMVSIYIPKEYETNLS